MELFGALNRRTRRPYGPRQCPSRGWSAANRSASGGDLSHFAVHKSNPMGISQRLRHSPVASRSANPMPGFANCRTLNRLCPLPACVVDAGGNATATADGPPLQHAQTTERITSARDWSQVLARYREPNQTRSVLELLLTMVLFGVLWLLTWLVMGVGHWMSLWVVIREE